MFYIGAHISVGAPLLGNMDVPSFLWAFEIKRYIKRYVNILYKRVSLSQHRGPVGEPGGYSLAAIREKTIVYLGSFPGPRGY
jgi:hypothetical protein